MHRQRVRRRRRLKAHPEKNHLPARMRPRQFHRVQRRIDDPDIAAGGFDRQQVFRAARHPQHVAKRAEDHFGTRGDIDGLVDQFERRHANRTTRTVN